MMVMIVCVKSGFWRFRIEILLVHLNFWVYLDMSVEWSVIHSLVFDITKLRGIWGNRAWSDVFTAPHGAHICQRIESHRAWN